MKTIDSVTTKRINNGYVVTYYDSAKFDHVSMFFESLREAINQSNDVMSGGIIDAKEMPELTE